MIAWLKRLWRSLWHKPSEPPPDPEVMRLVILHQKLNLIAAIRRELDDQPCLTRSGWVNTARPTAGGLIYRASSTA